MLHIDAALGMMLALFAALLAGPSPAAPGDDVERLLSGAARFQAVIEAEPETDVLQLAASTGLERFLGTAADQEVPQAPALPPEPPRFAWHDPRLVLAAFAQSYGYAGTSAVIRAAPSEDTRALVVRSGTARLADLAAAFGVADASAQADRFVLPGPLVIERDAALVLSPGQTLAMDRTRGAYILVLGRLEVRGATIESTGGQNARIPSYRPFFAIGGSGSFIAVDSRFRDLGLGRSPQFTGISVARSLLARDRGITWLENNRFENMYSVHVANSDGAAILGNRFGGIGGPALTVFHSPGARIARNIFTRPATTNAIHVSGATTDVHVENNIVLSGERSGIVVKQGSDRARIRGNFVWGRTGSGIIFAGSDCGVIEGNAVLDNEKKGIEVRTSRGTVVAHNLVAGQRSVALWVSAQPPDAVTYLLGNRLVANRVGVATATGGIVEMAGNDFTRQIPRLVDGDLSFQAAFIARDLQGHRPLRLTAAEASEPQDVTPGECGR